MIDFLNSLEVDLIIGLGDIECPQFIHNYKGILGEMENVTVQKYLKKNGLLAENILDLSISFSSRKVITHFPPRRPRGSQVVLGSILSQMPELVFHGHIEEQGIYTIGEAKVISVGSLEKGYFVIYERGRIELKRRSH